MNIKFEMQNDLLVKEIWTSWFKNKIGQLQYYFNVSEKIIITDRISREDYEQIPKWAVAFTHEQTVFLLNPYEWIKRYRIDMIVIHEIVHAITNKLEIKLPLILFEGMAVYFADQLDSIELCDEDIDGLSSTKVQLMDYSSPNFYDVSGYLFQKLVKKIGIKNVIEYIRSGDFKILFDYWDNEVRL
ncbi:peptidase MA superfamily [Gottschalkia purinilytica]|uniref:Peptidase MA superfamily n=1 Tax=Gottschalkia purinilytica TaxID=1503 RepID=A0A0L0W996_GOTPU|nr:hypothetical protein [Gottschalkia purinilytica]KNF07890.1 peptidase MA superfamily [Gottschalkia purinilytica]